MGFISRPRGNWYPWGFVVDVPSCPWLLYPCSVFWNVIVEWIIEQKHLAASLWSFSHQWNHRVYSSMVEPCMPPQSPPWIEKGHWYQFLGPLLSASKASPSLTRILQRIPPRHQRELFACDALAASRQHGDNQGGPDINDVQTAASRHGNVTHSDPWYLCLVPPWLHDEWAWSWVDVSGVCPMV